LADDERPDFLFNDANRISINRIFLDIKKNKTWASLKNVKDFQVSQTDGIPDRKINDASALDLKF